MTIRTVLAAGLLAAVCAAEPALPPDAAYVQVQHDDGRLLWGAGVDPSIEMAGLKALVTAWNLLR